MHRKFPLSSSDHCLLPQVYPRHEVQRVSIEGHAVDTHFISLLGWQFSLEWMKEVSYDLLLFTRMVFHFSSMSRFHAVYLCITKNTVDWTTREVSRERLLFILERKFSFVPLTSSSKSDSTVSLKFLQSIHHDPLFLFCCLLLSFHPHPSLLFLMSFAFLASFILCLDVCLSLDVASSSLFFVQLQLSSSSSSSWLSSSLSSLPSSSSPSSCFDATLLFAWNTLIQCSTLLLFPSSSSSSSCVVFFIFIVIHRFLLYRIWLVFLPVSLEFFSSLLVFFPCFFFSSMIHA